MTKIKTQDGRTPPVLLFWLAAGWIGLCVLPWYGVDDGFFSFRWLLDGWPLDEDYAPVLALILQGEKLWLAPLFLPLIIATFAIGVPKTRDTYALLLLLAGGIGFSWVIIQGFSIGIRGFNFDWMEAVIGKK